MSLYGTILRSADGDRWTEAADTGTAGSFHGVASDGSQFVAVGDVSCTAHWCRPRDLQLRCREFDRRQLFLRGALRDIVLPAK